MASLLSIIPKREYVPSYEVFDRLFDDFYPLSIFKEKDEWLPAFDIKENEKEYVVTAELPGMEPTVIVVTLSVVN